MRRVQLSVLTAVVMWATPAVAQEVKQLEPVVVTATKAETPHERLPAAVTVIDGGEIKGRHYATVPDVLRQVPGVEIQRSGTPGKNTTIKIRGATQEQIQVLVDGMRVKASTTGEFNPSNLAIDEIERIEVVRGPQATLYGADAIGGVVNIITKRGQGPPSATLALQGGNLETHREKVSLSGSHKIFDYALGASAFETGGSFKN
ncbi:MAG: TonB-dependent receptor plug domain-containing protein, partial [Dehalococcoidia bacterium]|nr:TonB-dependent receptor plug domain-containing protein [Dehalococcoidia bacterium]